MPIEPSPSSRFLGTVDDALKVALDCYRSGDKTRAARLCRQIVQVTPEHANAWHLWGVVALDERHYAAARERIERAIALRPSEAVYRNTLGEVHRALGHWEAALAAYHRALELWPDYAEAYNNLGVAQREMGLIDEAAASYERSLAIDPEQADAHYNRALLWLLQGDYERGWPEYEWRWRRAELPPREFHQPRWDGRPLAGGTVLVYCEQGLGDTLQFIRYLPLVKARCGTVIVECEPPLEKLLRGCRGIDRLVVKGSELPPFDMQAPLLSLPAIFGTTLDNVPAFEPYLAAEPELLTRWRAELRAKPGFKVGIVWQGSALYRRDAFRSIPLAAFAPLAAVPGVELYRLQKGPGTQQIAQAPFPVVDLGGRIDLDAGPFMDTAAIMQSLDLFITSDTAPAHLAGGLGVPVWLAASTMPDWRWLLAREDSPWYPTMRIFRQREAGRWDDVFARMAAELTHLKHKP